MIYAQDIIRSIMYKLSDLPLNLYKNLTQQEDFADYKIIFNTTDDEGYLSFIDSDMYTRQKKKEQVNLIAKIKEYKQSLGTYTEEELDNITSCKIYTEADIDTKYTLNSTTDEYKYEKQEDIPQLFEGYSEFILDLTDDEDVQQDKLILNIISNYSVPRNGVLTAYYTRVDLSLYTYNDITGEKTNKLVLDIIERLQRNFMAVDENDTPTKNILYIEDGLNFSLTEFNIDNRVSLGTLLIKNY